MAGADLPTWEDSETSFAELKARVAKTLDYIQGFTPDQIDGQEDRDITLVRRGETHVFKAQAYLLGQAMPNFFFHTATAYNILRKNGVEVGKRDYLGL